MYSCIDWRAPSILFLQATSWSTLLLNSGVFESLSRYFLESAFCSFDRFWGPPLDACCSPDWGLCSPWASESLLVLTESLCGYGSKFLKISLLTSFGHCWIKWYEYFSTKLLVLLTTLSKRWKKYKKYLLLVMLSTSASSACFFPLCSGYPLPFSLAWFSFWKSWVLMFLNAWISVVIALTDSSICMMCSST